MGTTNQFTDRERAVIDHLLQARTNKQIALALRVSVRTVEYHLGRIYSKLGVASRAEAIVRLAETHRWESTVAPAAAIPQDTPSPSLARRISMRTIAYIATFSLTSLLLLFLLTDGFSRLTEPLPDATTTPLPAPQEQTPPLPTETSRPEALPPQEFLSPPQSLNSSSGVTVEISHLVFGPNCLGLQVLATGVPAPTDVPLEDTTLSPFTAVDFYDPSSALSPFTALDFYDPSSTTPLTLRHLGGGGGGAPALDGTMLMGKEAVYDFNPPSIEGPIPMTVVLTVDEALGFDAPLVFHLQAHPTVSETCGLPGPLSP